MPKISRWSSRGKKVLGGRIRFLLAVTALGALVFAVSAVAERGGLTESSCITKPGSSATGCTTTGGTALDGASDVAVSPQGTNVYVTSALDDSLTNYKRDASTGALTRKACITKEGSGASGCSTPGGTALDGAAQVAISQDGRSVYVTANDDDSITSYSREFTTGALTRLGCVTKEGSTASGCSTVGGTALDGARGIAVSPDGRNVYVISNIDDSISIFSRNTTSGRLTAAGCIKRPGSSAVGCTTAGGSALGGAQDIAISPNGVSVYVVSYTDSAVTTYSRNTTTGALTSTGCVTKVGSSAGGCSTIGGDGLGGATDVDVSPDGLDVFVVSIVDDALIDYHRDASTGALYAADCQTNPGSSAGGDCKPQSALNGATGVTVSPEGDSVYVASYDDSAVAIYARDVVDGGLGAQTSCIAKPGSGAAGCRTDDGGALGGTSSIAVPLYEGNVYVASFNDDSVTVFKRQKLSSAEARAEVCKRARKRLVAANASVERARKQVTKAKKALSKSTNGGKFTLKQKKKKKQKLKATVQKTKKRLANAKADVKSAQSSISAFCD